MEEKRSEWQEKISTKVNFPITGLDMADWCDESFPTLKHNYSFQSD